MNQLLVISLSQLQLVLCTL